MANDYSMLMPNAGLPKALADHLGPMDALETQRIINSGLPQSMMPGIKPMSAVSMASRIVEASERARKSLATKGQQRHLEVTYKLIDNAVLEAHYFGERGISERIRFPLQFGMTMRTEAQEIINPTYSPVSRGFYRQVREMGKAFKQPGFVAPGFLFMQQSGKHQFKTLAETMVGAYESELEGLHYQDVRSGLRSLRRTAAQTLESAVWTSHSESPQALMPLNVPQSVLQASRVRVIAPSGKLAISQFQDIYAFTKGGQLDVVKAVSHMRKYFQYLGQSGVLEGGLTWLGDKPEAALKGFLSKFTPGHEVPFGMHADPTRQAYQAWGLLPLIARQKGIPRRYVSTPTYEAAAKSTGKGAAYWVPTKVLYTADPRIEAAVSASEGGMIAARSLMRRMEYFMGAEKKTPGINQAIMAGRIKGTVSALANIDRDIGVITSSKFIGKHPDALRSQIVSNIMSQVGPISPGGVGKERLKFLKRLGSILGGEIETYGPKGSRRAQFLAGPKAVFDIETHLPQVEEAVDAFTQATGIRISKGFKQVTAGVRGIGGVIEGGVRGWEVEDAVALRAEQEFWGQQATNWAIGRKAGQQVTSLGQGIHAEYTSVYGRGTKIRLKDVINISMYGTPEAKAMAEVYSRIIEGYQPERKKDLLKAALPLVGQHRVPGGISAASIYESQPFRPLGAASEQGYYTAEMLRGTYLDPEQIKRSLTVNLPGPVKISDLAAKERYAEYATQGLQQIHVPSPHSLGLREVTLETGEKVYYLDEALRAAQQVAESVQAGDSRAAVNRWFSAFAKRALGKDKLFANLVSPEMNMSAYLRMVPRGEGPAARALGTALSPVKLATGEVVPAEATALISRATVEEMGEEAVREFMTERPYAPVGSAWLRSTRYPAQGAAHEQFILTKIADVAEKETIGPGGLGVHTAMALLQRGDFDADNISTLLISGATGQWLSYKFAKRHTFGELEGIANFMREHLSGEQRRLFETGNAPSVPGGAVYAFREWLGQAKSKVEYIRHLENSTADARLMEFFGTKVLTPALDTWSRAQHQIIATGEHGAAGRYAGAIVDEVVQKAAMAKGEAASKAAVGLASLYGAYTPETLKNEAKYREALGRTTRAVHTMWLGQQEYGKMGELGSLSLTQLREGAKVFLETQMSYRAAHKFEAGSLRMPSILMGLIKGKGEKDVGDLFSPLQAALEGATRLGEKEYKRSDALVARALGLTSMLASGEMEALSALGKLPDMAQAASEAVHDSAGLAKELPAPILDKVIDWFRRPKTPDYQKAGVILGTALLGTAIVKNLFFPGYVPDDGGPDQVPVPIPVRMPAAEAPVSESMFSRIPDTRTPVDSSFTMPPDYVNMGVRTPLQAVQMGAGTMQPGVLPKLTGGFFREPPPAPMVLNQDRYNAEAPGGVDQPVVTVAAPEEGMASGPMRSLRVGADLPVGGFNSAAFAHEVVPQAEVRFENSAEESEYEILRAIEEQERSAWT